MNFAPGRIVKILRRQGDALKARPELARHLALNRIQLKLNRFAYLEWEAKPRGARRALGVQGCQRLS
jgi:hypothetical protein